MKERRLRRAATFSDKSVRCALSCFVCFLFWIAVSDTASAEGISGYLDYQYSLLDSETKNVDGQVSNTRTTTFNQQYNLTFLRTLYPNLRLYANGIFEKDYVKFRTDGVDTTSKTTIMRPQVDLSLKTPFYYAGVNYNMRQERDETTGASTSTATNIREEYNALLGWKPSGLPSIEGRYTRTHTYDKELLNRNTVEDFTRVTAFYEPVKNLFVRYRGSYRDTNDLLQHVEVRQLTNNGRIDYNGGFFTNRLTVFGSYDYTRSDTETISNAGAEVLFQLFPFLAFFRLDDTVTPLVINPATDSRPFLLDQDRTNTNTGEIDLGYVPWQTGGNTLARNMALDFGTATEINTLRVWVDRFLDSTTVNSFTWDVYTSSDNQNWTQAAPSIVGAPFSQFENRFELRLPANVTARYIRIRAKPLLAIVPQVNANHIYVTEVETFLAKPAAKTFTADTGVMNLNLRMRLLDSPFLFYDLSYFDVRSTGVQRTMRSTLTNALVAAHTFNPVLSGTARVAREDSSDTKGYMSAYAYSASLRVVPLKTLTHSLTYSGRNELNPDGRLNRQTVFLSNTADLYKGVSLFFGGGYSFATIETGQDQTSTSFNAGSTIAPHEKVTLTLNYSSTDSSYSGGGQPDSTTISQRSDISVSIRPFQTVYLAAMLSTVHQNGLSDTLQNYSINWLPFQGGALQLGFSYNETLRAADNSVDKILRPSLRWNITKKSYLDAAYLNVRSTSNTQDIRSQIFNVNLRIPFD